MVAPKVLGPGRVAVALAACGDQRLLIARIHMSEEETKASPPPSTTYHLFFPPQHGRCIPNDDATTQ